MILTDGFVHRLGTITISATRTHTSVNGMGTRQVIQTMAVQKLSVLEERKILAQTDVFGRLAAVGKAFASPTVALGGTMHPTSVTRALATSVDTM